MIKKIIVLIVFLFILGFAVNLAFKLLGFAIVLAFKVAVTAVAIGGAVGGVYLVKTKLIDKR